MKASSKRTLTSFFAGTRFRPRFSARLLRSGLIAAVAVTLALAPLRVSAYAPPPAPDSAPAAASAPSGGSAAAQNSGSESDEEKAFLHSSTVQAVARLLHLDLETTIRIFLGINFAVIFFLIAVPIGRFMPKIVRRRSRAIRHDLEAAREATADAQARLKAVEAELAGLGDEIDRFRAQVEQEALEDEKRIKASLAEESARIVSAAEQEIVVAVAQAKRGLRALAADLAIEHAAKQMRLTPQADHALIAEFIAGVSGDGSGKGGRR